MRPELQALRTTGSILSITNVMRCYNCMIFNDIMIFYTLSLLFGVSRVGEVPGPRIHHRGAAIPNGPLRRPPPCRTSPSISAEALGGVREDSSLQASKEVPGAIGSSAEEVGSPDLTPTNEACTTPRRTISRPRRHVRCRGTRPTHPQGQEYCCVL